MDARKLWVIKNAEIKRKNRDLKKARSAQLPRYVVTDGEQCVISALGFQEGDKWVVTSVDCRSGAKRKPLRFAKSIAEAVCKHINSNSHVYHMKARIQG